MLLLKKQRKQSKDMLSVKPKEIAKKKQEQKEKKKSKKIIQKQPEEVLALFKDTPQPEEEEALAVVHMNKETDQLIASVVMVGGLLLIVYGVYKIYKGNSAPTPVVKTEDFVL